MIVLILLTICITIDSADDNIYINDTTTNETLINETLINDTYILGNDSGEAVTDGKIYSNIPLATIKAKPSCGCNHGYYWHVRTFEDYCPHCHRYGVLRNVHKYPARYEQELTCLHCGADYCGVCGKEKYSWSHYRLTPKQKGVIYTTE